MLHDAVQVGAAVGHEVGNSRQGGAGGSVEGGAMYVRRRLPLLVRGRFFRALDMVALCNLEAAGMLDLQSSCPFDCCASDMHQRYIPACIERKSYMDLLFNLVTGQNPLQGLLYSLVVTMLAGWLAG